MNPELKKHMIYTKPQVVAMAKLIRSLKLPLKEKRIVAHAFATYLEPFVVHAYTVNNFKTMATGDFKHETD